MSWRKYFPEPEQRGLSKGNKNLEGDTSLDGTKQAKADFFLSFQSRGQDYHRAGVGKRFDVMAK